MAVPILACALIFVALAYQLVMFLTELMTSYSFENNRIVKGKIQNKIPPSAASLINDADKVDDFINQAVENVNSEHPDYTILRSENEKYSLRLGSSEGYVDIH